MTETIALASDHAGPDLKAALSDWLRANGFAVEDLGTHGTESVDYPDYANALADWIKTGKGTRGILICGSGVGISIAANRHKHIRAALCTNTEITKLCRQHNDANVLVLGARFTDEALAKEMLQEFLETPFEGGRHAKRVEKLG